MAYSGRKHLKTAFDNLAADKSHNRKEIKRYGEDCRLSTLWSSRQPDLPRKNEKN